MLNAEVRQTPRQTTGDFLKFGKRPGKRRETFRSSANAPANDGRLSEARQTARQTTADFPKLGKRLGKQRDEKQETIYNHFNLKKHFYYGKRK